MICVLAVAIPLFAPFSVARTAAVRVPPSWSGYRQVHITGASLYALDNTLRPGDEAIVASTVWLVGPPAARSVRVRVGAGDWGSCDHGVAQPTQVGVVTSYRCRFVDGGNRSADIWISVAG